MKKITFILAAIVLLSNSKVVAQTLKIVQSLTIYLKVSIRLKSMMLHPIKLVR